MRRVVELVRQSDILPSLMRLERTGAAQTQMSSESLAKKLSLIMSALLGSLVLPSGSLSYHTMSE